MAEVSEAAYSKRFIYAPPFFDLKSVSGRRLPVPPYSSAPLWKNSIFYYWWEYLRCNETYAHACTGKGPMSPPLRALYKDFGNVHEVKFKRWWQERGEYLFAEPPAEQTVLEMRGSTFYQLPGTVVVRIPLQQPLHVTFAQIRELIGERVAIAKGKDKLRLPTPSRALYPIVRKVPLQALDRYLRAWKARQRYPKDTLFELAERLDANSPADTPRSDAKYRIVMTNEMSRRIRLANNLINHVGKGVFPRIDNTIKYRLLLAEI